MALLSFQKQIDPGKAPQSPRSKTFLVILHIGCWVFLLGVFGVWLLLQAADRWWSATILMFAPRWPLFLPLLVLAPAILFVRSKLLGWLLLLNGLIIGGPVMGFCLPWKSLLGSSPSRSPLRVLTCNMHYSKADPRPLEELIAAAHPDLVVIQEWPGSKHSILQKSPGWHVHLSPKFYLASRFPIRRAIPLGHDSKGEYPCSMQYELETPLGLIHLFNCHLATARHGIKDTLLADWQGPSEVQENSRCREEQSAFVAGVARDCRGPVLLAGDFNTPPQSALFEKVWSDYTDSFSSAGLGWGYTFFGSRTMVRIDHILAGPGWSCTGCRVGPFVGSLHRPVIADLALSREAFPVEQ